ncbi:hypothetical protein A9485_08870 [Bacillus cereus]|uniref:hypothetical protein n=1 Tax=Bacillus cereus TaxID=1396 RepID=UPI0008FE29A8|nr:hypothetical protein [Bacillus cereus]OJD90334.1 hypothetical protein A9485_08870 [Bacillus cereus]
MEQSSVFYVKNVEKQDDKYFVHGYGYDKERNLNYEDFFTYYHGRIDGQYLNSEEDRLSKESIRYIRKNIIDAIRDYDKQEKASL